MRDEGESGNVSACVPERQQQKLRLAVHASRERQHTAVARRIGVLSKSAALQTER
jgi:hypothetical protein